VLRDRADQIEAARRLPADLSKRFAEADFYRLCVPAAYGGLETSVMTFLRIVEALATADGSSAWCVFIHATSAYGTASLPETTARKILAEPLATMSGVFAPRGEAVRAPDGVRVNGRWQWGSGISNAQWVSAGCLLQDDAAQPRRIAVVVPIEEVEVLDTWHVSGLCGTGSTDFALDDCFVPEERVQTTPRFPDRPLYRFPVFGLLSSPIAAISLGMARAAITELTGFASSKIPDASRRTLANRPSTQAEVATAEAMVRAARAYLYESVEAAYEAGARGELTTSHKVHVRLSTTHAVRTAARAVDTMYGLGGGTSVYRTSPLQRIFRDVHVATQHMMVGTATLELTGRVLLGLETDTSQI